MKHRNKNKINLYTVLISALLIFAVIIVVIALISKGNDEADTSDKTETSDTVTDTDTETDGETDTENDTASDNSDDSDESTDTDTDTDETEDAEPDTPDTENEPATDTTDITDTTDTPDNNDENKPTPPPAIDAGADGKTIICIDAGHGFDDPGCISDLLNAYEKDITLSIVMHLKSELEKLGATVVLTHDGESFPSAASIREMANEHGVNYDESRIVKNNIFSAYERAIYSSALHYTTPIDFFVSIHVNSIVGHPEISRYEMFYYEGNPHRELLDDLTDSLRGKLDNDSVTIATEADDSYTVTRWCEFPSILIETGYATNEDDAAKLNSDDWRRSFAEILAKEIIAALDAE